MEKTSGDSFQSMPTPTPPLQKRKLRSRDSFWKGFDLFFSFSSPFIKCLLYALGNAKMSQHTEESGLKYRRQALKLEEPWVVLGLP